MRCTGFRLVLLIIIRGVRIFCAILVWSSSSSTLFKKFLPPLEKKKTQSFAKKIPGTHYHYSSKKLTNPLHKKKKKKRKREIMRERWRNLGLCFFLIGEVGFSLVYFGFSIWFCYDLERERERDREMRWEVMEVKRDEEIWKWRKKKKKMRWERERERESWVMLGFIKWVPHFSKYLQKCHWVMLFENWKVVDGIF